MGEGVMTGLWMCLEGDDANDLVRYREQERYQDF